MAASSSSGHGGALPGSSPTGGSDQVLHGLAVRSKNTFLEVELPSETSSEGQKADDIRRKGSSAKRREHSAPPSVSCSRSSVGSSTGGGTAADGSGEQPSTEQPSGELPSGSDVDGEDNGALVDDEGADSVDAAGTRRRRAYNLCKNKRLRIRTFEVRMKEQLLREPNIDLESFAYPPFLTNMPDVMPKMLRRLCEFQQSVLAGDSPDPNHRSTRNEPEEASSSTQRDSSPSRGSTRRRGRHKRLVSL